MTQLNVQIYEIQEPQEAETMIHLGVHRIGSVLVSSENWKMKSIRDTICTVKSSKSKSSLIPLFSELELIVRVIDWYEPDIIHFCESLSGKHGILNQCSDFVRLQEAVKKKYPGLVIMRSIPIGITGQAHLVPTLELARMFESVSDEFLTDTLFYGGEEEQPVKGFVGITGKTCDWGMARKLVEQSALPVILAGGLSPDNVYEAAVSIMPFGVDSCTLTNQTDRHGKSIRFRKDPLKVRRFVDEALRAEKTIREIKTH